MYNHIIKYTPILDNLIGQGSFGKVYKTVEDENIVIKILDEKCYDKVVNIYNDNFIKITQGHPNLAHLYNYYIIENRFHIVLEYLEGKDLFDIIIENNGLYEPIYDETNTILSSKSNTYVKYILKQVLQALRYLHSNGIVHCDIKTENIRILNNGTIKLFDYTLVRNIGENLQKVGGTFGYIAPEIILHTYCENYMGLDHNLSDKADIWPLGLLLYLMIEGIVYIPLNSKKYIRYIIKNINTKLFRNRFDLNKWDDESLKLFDSMVVIDPNKRQSADYLLTNFFQ
jgi:serine/threonine protein kinase